MRLRSFALGLSLVGLTLGFAVGCGDEAEVTGAAGGAASAAFTVESGHRFVVSATPEKIVLKKNVDGAEFPFDENSLKGKAILIHPIERKGEGGVYARAITVKDTGPQSGGTYEIEAKPLTLSEMSTITEDDIVRIYIDSKSLAQAKKRQDESVLKPSALPTPELGLQPLNSPLSVSGMAFSGFNLGSGLDLATPLFVTAGISFNHTIERVSLEPEILANYSGDTGLDLGFRADFGWKSKITLAGRVSGEIMRSPTLKGPPMLIFVPIGWVPVPVTIQGQAVITCNASVSGLAETDFTIEASAKIGGSLRVKPDTGKAPADWITQGAWPSEATGDASVTTSRGKAWSAAVSCSVPRLEVHADIAGVAGPYLAVAPIVTVKSTGATLETKLSAGVAAGLLGLPSGVEIALYSWKPE